MGEKVQMRVVGVSKSANSKDFYCLLLEEVLGDKKLPIVIGQNEAQMIVVSVDKIKMMRPLLPDVFMETAKEINLQLLEVFIYKKQNGVYFTKIIWQLTDTSKVEVEARPSDAIALALRSNAPIFIEKSILEQYGVSPSNQNNPQVIELPLCEMTKNQLKILLQEAVEDENYEQAAIIRDLLKTKI